jgi:23S rRNA (uracil1939-C5)-methyltransferase
MRAFGKEEAGDRTIQPYAAGMTDPLDEYRPRPTETVTAERLVAGGAALSRRSDGRIVLVEGALPGEVAEVRVERRHGAERGRLLRILEPSVDRIEPRCPHVLEGCGGCDLAALGEDAQRSAKLELVTDSLRRLGRLPEPVVRPGPVLSPWSFRTTLRLAVVDGRAGLRQADSHDIVELDRCAVAHPLLDQLIVEGRFGTATEVMLRVGASTGERMAVVTPGASGVSLPSDVLLVGADELAAGRRAWIHEDVAGRRWRISAESFFQTRADGAEALVSVVRSMCADLLDRPGSTDRPRTMLDAYCGVGLFAGSLLDGVDGWRAVAAERSRSSVADARQNLADLDARIVGSSIERLRAPRAELVIADPSRSGLGRAAVKVLTSTGASRMVLVSCDPAAAGRDVRLLAEAGFRAIGSVVVDLFPHTHHTEVVTSFERLPA